MRQWRVGARHRWLAHCIITESVRDSDNQRRFTATIYGFRNYKIWEGPGEDVRTDVIIGRVRELRDQLDSMAYLDEIEAAFNTYIEQA